ADMQPEYSLVQSEAPPASGSRFIQILPRIEEFSVSGLRWRGLWSSVPALLLLGLAAGATQLSPPQPLGDEQDALNTLVQSSIQSDWEKGIIPLQATAIVAPQAESTLTWRGTLQS